MRTIEILIAPDGSALLQTTGFAGPACLEAGRRYADALGTATDVKRTAAYYESAAEATAVEERNGRPTS